MQLLQRYFLAAFIISIIGAITIYSVTFQVDGEDDFIIKQSIYILLGIMVYVGISYIPDRYFRVLPVYIFGFMVLMLVLTLFIGTEINGARRWIFIFGQSIQFSELIKPFFVMLLAIVLSNDKFRFTTAAAIIGGVTTALFLLLYLQPDFDTGVSFILTGALVFLLVKKKYTLILGLLGAVVILSPVVYFFILSDFQQTRIDTFFMGILEGEYQSNIALSIQAISSGGLFGKGIGFTQESILRILPSRQTDFIFAVMVENFGIFGMFFVFYLYWLLLSSILKIYRNTNSTFVSTFALGTFIVFTFQIVQNIGTNIGLFPASGVVLPFMSYGGSGMLTNFIFLGTLNAIKDDKVYETQTEETDLNLSPSKLN